VPLRLRPRHDTQAANKLQQARLLLAQDRELSYKVAVDAVDGVFAQVAARGRVEIREDGGRVLAVDFGEEGVAACVSLREGDRSAEGLVGV
jgi:hypothetical protein